MSGKLTRQLTSGRLRGPLCFGVMALLLLAVMAH